MTDSQPPGTKTALNAVPLSRVFALTTAATALSAALTALLARLFYNPRIVPPDYGAFVMAAKDFHPEPVERMQYMAVLAVLPFAAWGWNKFLKRRCGPGEAAPVWLAYAALTLAALAAAVPMITRAQVVLRTAMAFPFALAAALICAAARYRYGPKIMDRKYAAWCAAALLITAMTALAGTQVFGFQSIDTAWDYAMHFGSVFHSVEEVWAGKTLLVDFNNQYGLYPVFLLPLFKLTGLSVLKFTIVMAVLEVAAWLFLFMALRIILSSTALAALTCGTAIFICQMHAALLYHLTYFQGVPIRLLAPAAALWLACKWFYNDSGAAKLSCGAVSSLAVLWNFDTGIVLFIAWTLALAYQNFLRHGFSEGWKPAGKDAALNAVFLFLAVGLYALYAKARAGGWPDFEGFLSFVSYFFGQGYFMIKMPLLHGWLGVALIYIAGLSYCAAALDRREYSPRNCAVFFLTILGCGLFSYYQGRSVTSNLQFVSWPAIALAALALEHAGSSAFRPARILASVGIGALLFCSAGAAGALPAGIANLRREALPVLREAESSSTRKADFIKQNVAPGEEVIILSYNAAAYHLQSGTKNPLKLPGMAELYLKREVAAMAAVIGEQKHKVFREDGAFIFHDGQKNAATESLEGNYAAVKQSPDGMTLYLPKSSK